VAETSATLAPR